MSEVGSSVADQAGVLAWFFSRRGHPQTQALHLSLFRMVSGNLDATTPTDRWRTADEQRYLWRFDPLSASGHDTTVIQVALNAPGDVVDAWTMLRDDLRRILRGLALDALFGYTLVFEAPLTPGTEIETALKCVLPELRRRIPCLPRQSLARADLAGGHLALLEVPLTGDAIDTATVYVALSSPDRERGFVQQMLFGPSAKLVIPELIAHKCYFQKRQYLGLGVWEEQEQQAARLRTVTTQLLDDLGKRVAETDEVDDLAKAYGALAGGMPRLTTWLLSLQQQVVNFDRQIGHGRAFTETNLVLDFHRDHLETGVHELALKVTDSQNALAAATGAADLAQVRIEREQEQQQEWLQRQQTWTQTLLAILAAALAVPALFDQEAARHLIRLFGMRAPAEETGFWRLLGVQILVVALVAVIFSFGGKWLGKWWTRRGQRA